LCQGVLACRVCHHRARLCGAPDVQYGHCPFTHQVCWLRRSAACSRCTSLSLTPRGRSWRRILLGGVMLAVKVWDDQAFWNADFCAIFSSVPVEDLNSLEKAFLVMIRFSVSVKVELYTKVCGSASDVACLAWTHRCLTILAAV